MGHRRVQLHKLFQAVNNCEPQYGEEIIPTPRLCDTLANAMVNEINSKVLDLDSVNKSTRFFTSALNVAGFFVDAGWFVQGKKILTAIKCGNAKLKRCLNSWRNSNISELTHTECQMRLLHVTCVYCNFSEAEIIYQEMLTKVPIPSGMCIQVIWGIFEYEICLQNYKILSPTLL